MADRLSSLPTSFTQEQITGGSAAYRSLNVEGIDEIKRIFSELPKSAVNRIKKETMLSALRPMLNDVKGQLPIRTGKLVNSVKMRATNKRTGIVYGQVTTTGKDGSHGDLIERGWWLTTHKLNLGVAKVSRRIKFIPGRHIFRRVLESHANRAVDEFSRAMFDEAKKAEQAVNGGA